MLCNIVFYLFFLLFLYLIVTDVVLKTKRNARPEYNVLILVSISSLLFKHDLFCLLFGMTIYIFLEFSFFLFVNIICYPDL